MAKLAEDFVVTVDGEAWTVPLVVSHSLVRPQATLTRAVVVVHGAAGNASDYFDYAAEAVAGSPDMLIVAPRFVTNEDHPSAHQLRWSEPGWKQGDASLGDGGRPRVSSFAVLDAIVKGMHEAFPSLGRVVFVGHSAGGQFVQRYAATSSNPRDAFVVANPSSYLYPGPERPVGDRFMVPKTSCRYNEYKYGFVGLNDHMKRIGVDALRERYAQAHVLYLLGGGDTDPEDPSLDATCEADAQGANRLDRGQSFYRYLAATYGPAVYQRHEVVIVPGVGHSGRDMILSAAARAAMLGDASVRGR